MDDNRKRTMIDRLLLGVLTTTITCGLASMIVGVAALADLVF